MSDMKALEARVAALEAAMAVMTGGSAPSRAPARAGSAGPGRSGQTSDDRDLDSQYGDPKVFRDPWGWKGRTYKDEPFSRCPADFLEAIASDKDKYGEKLMREGDEIKAGYQFREAARARGWARRSSARGPAALPARDDFAPTPQPSVFDGQGDDQIPF